MHKLRVSYTLLNLWKAGRVSDAVSYYFKLPLPKTPALEEGKKWDNYVNDFVTKHKKLPPEFGGDRLKAPQTQVKIFVPYNPFCDLVGVFDILDGKTLIEIKSGVSKDSGGYALDFQVDMYLLLAGLRGIAIDKALIIHYDQFLKEHDRTLIWNSNFEIQRARNFIDTLTPEIHEYFTQYDLWNKKFDMAES